MLNILHSPLRLTFLLLECSICHSWLQNESDPEKGASPQAHAPHPSSHQLTKLPGLFPPPMPRKDAHSNALRSPSTWDLANSSQSLAWRSATTEASSSRGPAGSATGHPGSAAGCCAAPSRRGEVRPGGERAPRSPWASEGQEQRPACKPPRKGGAHRPPVPTGLGSGPWPARRAARCRAWAPRRSHKGNLRKASTAVFRKILGLFLHRTNINWLGDRFLTYLARGYGLQGGRKKCGPGGGNLECSTDTRALERENGRTVHRA